MPNRAYRRDERKDQIVLAFNIRYANVGESPMTMTLIAKKLDMRPSGHLSSILKEMVADGILEVTVQEYRNSGVSHFYKLKPGTYTMPKRLERMVKFTVNGTKQEALGI